MDRLETCPGLVRWPATSECEIGSLPARVPHVNRQLRRNGSKNQSLLSCQSKMGLFQRCDYLVLLSVTKTWVTCRPEILTEWQPEQVILAQEKADFSRFVRGSFQTKKNVVYVGLEVSGFEFRVAGFGFQVSSFEFRVSGFGFGVWGVGFRI